jgi:hypothetical protein
VDDVTWGALALVLTALGGAWTWLAFRRRGLASGLRASGFTLLPAAAWLTGTLELLTRIAEAVAHWATRLVFNPFVWVGVVLAGVSALLLVASRLLRARELGGRPERAELPQADRSAPPAGRGAPAIDDDLADIEALLRRRGIT